MTQPTDAEIRARVEGRTVPAVFLETVARLADRTAVRRLEGDDTWQEWTFGELAQRAAKVAGGLGGLGVQRGDRVVLMMRNIPEFHAIDLGVMLTGATPVSIYNSSSPEQIGYLAGHCGANVAVVEDEAYLDRFLAVRDELPNLEAIIVLNPPATLPDGVHGPGLFDDAEPVDLETAAAIAQPDDLATIIYTSGTTGSPKGVMLTHYNLVWTGESLLESFGWDREGSAGRRLVSYLPMAHIAERMTSHYGMGFFGYEIACCPEPGLIAKYAGMVKPNLMFGVPRVWEKIHAGVTAALALDPEKAEKFNEAVEAAKPIVEKMTWGEITDEERATYEFLDAVAFSTVRQLVGMDELELAVSGAAPIPADLITWFRTIGVPLAEIYGMSESTGPITFAANTPKAGTVGPAIPGLELKIADDGEVCFRGGNVFVGYLNNAEATADTVDEEGWVHTGDIGELDDDGYLRIVDRKKELIITAGGKNISPANLEAALKTIPIIGQAATIGDNRPFVSALLALDPEVAPVWATQQGIEFTDLADLATKPEVADEIARGVEEAMVSFNNAERVKKWVILGEEWLPDSDLLTPTSKLKRRGILARYEAEIEGMYAS